MNSSDIQQKVYQWATESNFTAPYGVLMGEGQSSRGKKYKSVTFGRARTLDCEVQIYNRSFIVVRSSRHGSLTFTSYESLQEFLNGLS